MNRLLRVVWRLLVDYCLRPVWRSLAAFGSIYVGRDVLDAETAPTPRSRARFARYAQGRFLALPPGVGGPPAAHPERLCEDVPLSVQERLLARELWPAYERRARDLG
ncbi:MULTISPECIES: DUF6059 family protein [unclassified Streptomyces]|uniref:DUF6059 family protein n=1 Tax=unclassified Streptomyces TaxID=2593676 RepID=UPI0036E87505